MTKCNRCDREIPEGQEETCFFCGAALCNRCWDEYGHCGEPEAEMQNNRARAQPCRKRACIFLLPRRDADCDRCPYKHKWYFLMVSNKDTAGMLGKTKTNSWTVTKDLIEFGYRQVSWFEYHWRWWWTKTKNAGRRLW
jgi:hypothetical protein